MHIILIHSMTYFTHVTPLTQVTDTTSLVTPTYTLVTPSHVVLHHIVTPTSLMAPTSHL